MKLKSLHIEDYKLFKDFDIDFLGSDGEALPIIVLAGVNGSGKTTLFDFILSLLYSEIKSANFIDIFLNNQREKEARIFNFKNNVGNIPYKDDEDYDKDIYRHKMKNEKYNEGLIFFPSGIDDTKKVADEFVKTFYDFLKNHDYRPSEVKGHFHNYMQEIFDDLDLTFKYSHLDKEDNVWFTNSNGDEFKINGLSTGEKTLLSKVLYLYFKDYKDKVILIDEPELSLHPSWQNRVLKIYENFAKISDCQIIIATHSPHIIGSAKNEYLRILKKNDDGKVEVIKDLKAEGRDINSILFDVMGEVAYRPREFDDKIDRLHIAIDDKKFDEANQRLEELKLSYGENDAVVMEAQMLIDMFSQED